MSAERDEVLTHIADDVKQISVDMKELTKQFNDYRVSIEGRLTKVELKASFIGALVGGVSGFLTSLSR
jgi:hypothetical protein